MNQLQVFNYKGSNVTFSNESGMWVNATEMAKKFDRQPYDWLRLQSTKDFISALVEIRGFNTADLVFNTADSTVLNSIGISNFIKIENGKYGGTWFHEDVAIEFARWLSPLFAIWCNDRIKEILSGNTRPMTKAEMRLQVFMDMQSNIDRLSNIVKRQGKRIAQMRCKLESEKEKRKERLLLEHKGGIEEFEKWIPQSGLSGEVKLSAIVSMFSEYCRTNDISCLGYKTLSKALRKNGCQKIRKNDGTWYKIS